MSDGQRGNLDWILASDRYLEGSKIIPRRMRPLRLAYIVPDNDANVALRAIESCCLTWGGITHFLIPHSREKGLRPEWRTVLKIFDPDQIVDGVGMAEEDQARFRDAGQFVHNWSNPSDSLFVLGMLQYSAFQAAEWKAEGESSRVAIYPTPEESHPLYLPLVARYGSLNEEGITQDLERRYLDPGIRYHNFIRVETFSTADNPIQPLMGLPPPSSLIVRVGAGSHSLIPIVDLTTLRLRLQSPSYLHGGVTPEQPQRDEAYVNTLLVTGRSGSIEDLCLYWNLRANRRGIHPFPIWIPLEYLDTEESSKTLKQALALMDPRRREGLARRPELHILSSSMFPEELKGTIKTRLANDIGNMVFPGDFTPFFAKDFMVGEERSVEVGFATGRVQVPLPGVEEFKGFASFDRIAVEISIENTRLPQSDHLGDRIYGVDWRISKHGLVHWYYLGFAEQYAPLRLPSGWSVLEAVMEDGGFTIEPSDKGRIALGILRLVGGLFSLGILASSRVFELLRSMSEIHGRQHFQARLKEILSGLEHGPTAVNIDLLQSEILETMLSEGQFDRVYRPFSWIQNQIGQRHARSILQWLIEHDILFRGAELICPICGLRKWYEIDRLGKQFHCDGCQNNSAIPLSPDSMEWRYRINELYALAVDQGAIPHLLAIYRLHFPEDYAQHTSTLGYFPGLKLKARSESARSVIGTNEMEVDLAAIRDGRPIIGECKTTGAQLGTKEIDRYVSLAEHLECSRLIFASMTDFSDQSGYLKQVEQKTDVVIETWTREDLLDLTLTERRGQPLDQSAASRDGEYLNEIVSRTAIG